MHAPARSACAVAVVSLLGARALSAQAPDRRQLERLEQTLRQEGQAVVALADAADSRSLPSDFTIAWHNDFLKAQTGTFIPFVVSVEAKPPHVDAALLYVRAARSREGAADAPRRGRRADPPESSVLYPFEEVYPIALSPGSPVRIARGFSLPAGRYELTVVVREREREDDRRRKRFAGTLRQTLEVPDFTTPDLTTSSLMLADALKVLPAPPSEADLRERPYVIGSREIQPAADARFRPSEELIVVLLVYNPAVTADRHFDLQVEYHFFRKSRAGPAEALDTVPAGLTLLPGERYFNRTEPQRFTPLVLGAQFDPASGQPVLAGQGVPLAGFPEGDYRLAVKVTDLVAGRSIERHLAFTVRQ